MRVVSGEWMRGFSAALYLPLPAVIMKAIANLDGLLHGKAGIVWERFLLLRVSM